MRINKLISETGIMSRREVDQYISEKRITINGVVAELGSQATADDDVRVDGKPIRQKPQLVYIALNKPVGITCTTERHIKGNIIDFVNHPQRIFPIGRLDKDSDGLILLTNDGDIVNRILRAENMHDKEYIVTVDKPVTPFFLKGMSEGVRILGTKTLPCKMTKVSDRVFRIVLNQGLNRQIRRMCAVFGYKVQRLQRVRIMNIKLGNLKIGEWRDLSKGELGELFDLLHYHPSESMKM
ncbi:23S rRNA pseudouridine(2604) synthase RluF [Ammoniphilus resinae]|uniref:Pseudouridine synthase n=1 Tax=Ammoniphilus resinae TaxID=861532 RepID=A0ABS4GVU4_9BACL|nr:23S rRNA pseudouridine(2604) synthase RluF [Ammoniphilus resinae]MBP1934376.1 23S rRNA pseudouridine2604 synthase [Ammoniphilus resinae]